MNDKQQPAPEQADYDLAYKIVEQMGLGYEFRNCRCGQLPCARLRPIAEALANREAEIRADLLQRVPNEKRLAEIQRRSKVAQDMIKAGLRVEPRLSWEDVDYLLSLLQQPPAASERCGERRCVKCGHDNFNAVIGECDEPSDTDDKMFCGCKCVFPATGATTEHGPLLREALDSLRHAIDLIGIRAVKAELERITP